MILREWNVKLLDPAAGRHMLRYLLISKRTEAKSDSTWTFTIADR